MITPMQPLLIETDEKVLEKLFCHDTFKEDYKVLNTEVRKLGYNIPPLVNAYMSLSPTMRMFVRRLMMALVMWKKPVS